MYPMQECIDKGPKARRAFLPYFRALRSLVAGSHAIGTGTGPTPASGP